MRDKMTYEELRASHDRLAAMHANLDRDNVELRDKLASETIRANTAQSVANKLEQMFMEVVDKVIKNQDSGY